MIERFDLGSVSRNPAVFDVTKLEWMNGHYPRAMPPVEFTAMALPIVESDLGRTSRAMSAKPSARLHPRPGTGETADRDHLSR